MESKIGTGESLNVKMNCDVACCSSSGDIPQSYEITLNQAKDIILASRCMIRFDFIRETVEENGISYRKPTRIFCQLTDTMLRAVLEISNDNDSKDKDDNPGAEKNPIESQNESKNEGELSSQSMSSDSLTGHKQTDFCNYKINQTAFKCNLCLEAFPSKSSMTQHKRTHRRQTYLCEVCGAVLWYKHSFENHLAAHQSKKQQPWWKCDKCDSEYKTKEKLDSHKWLHYKLVEHRCQECNRVFHSSTCLKHHIIAIHLRSKPHFCTICGLSFAKEDNTKKHILRIHYPKKWAALEEERRKKRERRKNRIGSGA